MLIVSERTKTSNLLKRGKMADRNEKGQFVKGEYKGGPGRPTKAREERYFDILMTACTFADWQRIVEKAVEQAKRGEDRARRWLADYLVGAAEQRLDITSGGEKIIQVEYINTPYPITGLPSRASSDSTEPSEV